MPKIHLYRATPLVGKDYITKTSHISRYSWCISRINLRYQLLFYQATYTTNRTISIKLGKKSAHEAASRFMCWYKSDAYDNFFIMPFLPKEFHPDGLAVSRSLIRRNNKEKSSWGSMMWLRSILSMGTPELAPCCCQYKSKAIWLAVGSFSFLSLERSKVQLNVSSSIKTTCKINYSINASDIVESEKSIQRSNVSRIRAKSSENAADCCSAVMYRSLICN